jgi:hypothetical protein
METHFLERNSVFRLVSFVLKKGVVYVPVWNFSEATLELKPNNCLTVIEFSYYGKVQLIENADLRRTEVK